MKIMAKCYATLARLSRKDVRHYALEYRRAIAQGRHEQADMYLKFTLYNRAVIRECLTGEPISPKLLRSIDEIIKKVAARLEDPV
jgi:hypothetical protein